MYRPFFYWLVYDSVYVNLSVINSHLQVADGVNSLLIGNIGTNPTPLVLAGGNCSIQGFDADGNDEFWTVNILIIHND